MTPFLLIHLKKTSTIKQEPMIIFFKYEYILYEAGRS